MFSSSTRLRNIIRILVGVTPFLLIPTVVLAERELSAIGKRRYLKDKLEMAEPLSSSRRKTSRGSAAALDRSPLKPPRSSFDNVGEREMKVRVRPPVFEFWRCDPARWMPRPIAVHLHLGEARATFAKPYVAATTAVSLTLTGYCPPQVLSLVPAEAAATIGVGGSSDAPDVEPASRSSNGAQAFDSQRSIPIVDTETPGKVTLSMRAAGVTVVTYLGRGDGSGLPQKDPQDTRDMVVTLTETSAREIEGCAEIDAVRGKVREGKGHLCGTVLLLRASLTEPYRTTGGNAWRKTSLNHDTFRVFSYHRSFLWV